MSSLFPVIYLGPPQGVLVEPNFSVSFICRFALSVTIKSDDWIKGSTWWVILSKLVN